MCAKNRGCALVRTTIRSVHYSPRAVDYDSGKFAPNGFPDSSYTFLARDLGLSCSLFWALIWKLSIEAIVIEFMPRDVVQIEENLSLEL